MWEDLRRAGDVAVVGLGASGVAATRLLRAHGVAVYASDAGTGSRLERMGKELDALGAVVDLGRHDLDRIRQAGLVVLSPGVPPDAPPVVAARAGNVTIWAEAELGLRALDGRVPYIAVTGTNGKTTTTTMVAHLLVHAGRRAVAAGNIGTPISEIALSADLPDIMAVELSSFQLHDMPTVSPTIGVLTNLAPDHLDRYPSLDDYFDDKRRLFANASGHSIWVTNADDPASRSRVDGVRGQYLRFSITDPADAWYDRASGTLRFGNQPLLARRMFPLLGDHNVANALAAALAVRAAGVADAAIGEGLMTVRPLVHRVEPIREVDGVLWINDSKATNVASTEVALKAMDRPFVLLLGGRHKGEPYTKLSGSLEAHCRAIVAYGEAKPIVIADLADRFTVVPAGDFDDVLSQARKLAHSGDAVLLSPACSSYDMFQNYVERGNRFRAFAEAL